MREDRKLMRGSWEHLFSSIATDLGQCKGEQGQWVICVQVVKGNTSSSCKRESWRRGEVEKDGGDWKVLMGKIPEGLTRGYKSYCMKNLRVQVSNMTTYEKKGRSKGQEIDVRRRGEARAKRLM